METVDIIPAHGEEATVACPECESQNVRPSHSSYPLDQSKIAGSSLRFWRCDNCGSRFLGAGDHGQHRTRQRRRGSGAKKDPLGRQIQLTRWVKRWVFPTLVILSTILAVVYLLDRRNTKPTGEEGAVISQP